MRREWRDDRDGETVVAFGADGLDCGGGDGGIGGDRLDEAAGALNGGVVAAGVEDRPTSHHVIDDDHTAGAGQAYRGGEVIGVVLLVRIDKHQVEGLGPATVEFLC